MNAWFQPTAGARTAFWRVLPRHPSVIAIVLATLARVALAQLDAPPPVLVWERTFEAGLPRGRVNPGADIGAFAARPDGQTLALIRTPSGARLVAIDARGGQDYAVDLSANHDGAVLQYSLINVEDPKRAWIFLTWGHREGFVRPEPVSRLIAVDGLGRIEFDRPLPPLPPLSPLPAEIDRGARTDRNAISSARLRDGSLVLAGSDRESLPNWWFARFNGAGQLTHESHARYPGDHPTLITDVRATEDGGYQFLMFDLWKRGQREAVRRYRADNQLAARRIYPGQGGFGAAVLAGPTEQMRCESTLNDRRVNVLTLVDGRGTVVRQVGLGPLIECRQLVRTGGAIVMHSDLNRAEQPKTIVVGLTAKATPRWRLEMPATDHLSVAATSDGGALIATPDGPDQVRLARYRSP